MIGLSRRRNRDVNTWPGFVDALATLLMVIIFFADDLCHCAGLPWCSAVRA